MAKSQSSQMADEELLLLLAGGASTEVAIEKTGWSRRTIYRRLADREFKQKLQMRRTELVQRMSGLLTSAGAEGALTLLGLLKSEVSPSVRLGAAKAVLQLEAKLRDEAVKAINRLDYSNADWFDES